MRASWSTPTSRGPRACSSELLAEPWWPQGVELVEQPLAARRRSTTWPACSSPIPICWPTSRAPTAPRCRRWQGRYSAINIKLDKCGGFTEALALAREARALGLGADGGQHVRHLAGHGAGLPAGPALARWADLDGPLLQRGDREPPMRFQHGVVHPPLPALWG
jgi:L-alanine-DL-glutamate epimerase-like enolase superfamily enzyme